MLAPDTRLKPNGAECASKVMDGEAVIINLTNGTYYSMPDVGGAIWQMIGEERTLAEIVDGIVGRYDVARDQAERDARRLVDELVVSRLAVATAGAGDAPPPRTIPASARLPYAAPELTSYSDMADLVALDPPMPQLDDIVWTEPGGGPLEPRSR
ncbi:MAG: PqqD family protein [Gemmatimonadota bacterium]|nr:PqqD family protein [Gemmatimonadota bacterium]